MKLVGTDSHIIGIVRQLSPHGSILKYQHVHHRRHITVSAHDDIGKRLFCILLIQSQRRLTLIMRTSCLGLSFLSTLTSSIRFTTSMPASTLPNTVCLRSNHGVGTVVMKELTSVGVRTRVGHAQRERLGVVEARMEFVFEVAAPRLSPPVPSPSGSPV